MRDIDEIVLYLATWIEERCGRRLCMDTDLNAIPRKAFTWIANRRNEPMAGDRICNELAILLEDYQKLPGSYPKELLNSRNLEFDRRMAVDGQIVMQNGRFINPSEVRNMSK